MRQVTVADPVYSTRTTAEDAEGNFVGLCRRASGSLATKVRAVEPAMPR